MAVPRIETLFAKDIHRPIEEVIKVDQDDEQIIQAEIDEYVVTEAICQHFEAILDRYNHTFSQPTDGIGIWISGFFGSGKSSFAKMLGLALQNHEIDGVPAADRIGARFSGPFGDKVRLLLKQITERTPTEAVIFDVSTDRGIRSGNQTLTQIAYRKLLETLGYAPNLDLAELEINLEGENRLEAFQDTYARLFNKDWETGRLLIAFALQEASRVMHELEPETYATPDSWRQAAQGQADITAGLLAERAELLMDRRRPKQNLLFVVDEVGQFVARDVQKMLDVQGLVQSLGRVGRGRFWLAVTSQERLSEVVGGLDGSRVELARLMDRFPQELQVHLEPSDISEVTGHRVLAKNADAVDTLGALYDEHHGHLERDTDLSADIRLPSLSRKRFIDLYPLLPYHVDLVIQVVSGLRTQGGASKHVGGANRTIIKLAQQLLIRPDTDLASQPLGRLATVDLVYDLVSGNIDSEIRGKIASIPDAVDHPFAENVAKAVSLLGFVQAIHRTPENIAATLYPDLSADSILPQVQDALDALVRAHQVRLGDDGYRIPTPTEDDWERQRAAADPRPAELQRLYKETLAAIWKPQPTHNLHGTRVFKAGLVVNGERVTDGDLPVHVSLVKPAELEEAAAKARVRSQAERGLVTWVAAVNDELYRAAVEAQRSQEILARRQRQARGEEMALVAEEKQKLGRYTADVQARLTSALLSGSAFFRGNDRSPDPSTSDVRGATETLLAQTLPQVYDRYEEAAARVQKKDLDALLTAESLRGLPPVFSRLDLLRDENGTPVFVTERGPLEDVLTYITGQAAYGDPVTGRSLEDHYKGEPYGWDFDVVRLFAVALLRAGALVATSRGKEIDRATAPDARAAFSDNNLFRQASFRPRESLDTGKLLEAAQRIEETFGTRVPELTEASAAQTLRTEVEGAEPALQEAAALLAEHRLPGRALLTDALDQLRTIRTASQQSAILTFLSAHHQIADARERATDLLGTLTAPQLETLANARRVLSSRWPFLQAEPDLEDEVRDAAEALIDLLASPTFYRSLPDIERHAAVVRKAYRARHEEAATERATCYADALTRLHEAPGWADLDEDAQQAIAEQLTAFTGIDDEEAVPVPQLRADIDACPTRLSRALEAVAQQAGAGRVVHLRAGTYANGGISTEAELDTALGNLREAGLAALAEGKTLFLQ